MNRTAAVVAAIIAAIAIGVITHGETAPGGEFGDVVRGGMILMVLLFPLIMCGRIGAKIGSRRDAAGQGYWWGFFLGPIGWLVALFLDGRPECAACRERISHKATICPHCRSAIGHRATPAPS